jgi:hypothetical protein
MLAGLGAAVGVGIDAIFRREEVICARPARSAASLTLSPILSRGRAGDLLSLGF